MNQDNFKQVIATLENSWRYESECVRKEYGTRLMALAEAAYQMGWLAGRDENRAK